MRTLANILVNIVTIGGWLTTRYRTIQTWFDKYSKRRREEQVDKAVDNRDDRGVKSIIVRIVKNRQHRRDSS